MKLTRRDFAAGIAAGIAAPYLSRARMRRAPPSRSACARRSPAPPPNRRLRHQGRQARARSRQQGRRRARKAGRTVIEDDQTTNPGIVLAFSKLAAQSDIVGFLGSIRSTQVHAMAPDVLKLGKPVMIGGTDPNLTHMGNQWLFRFRPNDSYSGRVIADYGVNTLGKKKWAVVHSTDAFGTAGGKALTAALEKLGAPAVLDQGYANQSQDFTPGRARDQAVRRRHARLLLHLRERPRHLRPAAAPARRQHPLGRLALDRQRHRAEARRPRALRHLWRRGLRRGFQRSAPRRSASSTARPSRSRRTTRAPGPTTPSPSCAPPSTRPARPIPKIREAILAIKKYTGAEGEYNFDQNGDGLHGYNIVKNDKGTIVFDKHIDFND